MLICPQCEATNPDNNKFCQQCGNSLIKKHCHVCGAKVNYSEENCSECGTLTATLRWLIFAQPVNLTTETLTQNTLETELVTAKLTDSTEKDSPVTVSNDHISSLNDLDEQNLSLNEQINDQTTEQIDQDQIENQENLLDKILIEGDYFDKGKRYRLLSTERDTLRAKLESTCGNNLIGIKVVDTRPVQESRLDLLLRESQEVDEIKSKLANSLVKAYLAFEEYGSIVPRAYDGWQEEDQNIVIIEDRSQYLTLAEYVANESITFPHLLYLMKEMARLWKDLGTYKCRQSLFDHNNLCLDEDLTFCLKQLYPDVENVEYDLKDLVKLWQFFLEESHQESEQFNELIVKVNQGIIQTEKELCEHLEMIASQDLDQENLTQNMGEDFEIEIEAENINESDLITIVNKKESNPLSYTSEGNDIPTIVLPMQLLSLTDSGITDIGSQRDHNEDFFGLQTTMITRANPVGRLTQAKGLYIVCDGMGGHDAGEVASAMAVEKLQSYFKVHWQDEFPDEEMIKNGILAANQAIFDVNMENSRSGSGRMGTTLVMALVQDTKIAIAHVGDSRVYKITRKWGAEQLTIDHEVGQREIQRGVEPEIAYGRPDAYQLTQALGPRNNDFIQPDITFLDINEDTVLLLCSDGLCDNELVENNWETYLIPLLSSRVNLDHELLKLIDFANEYNGHDNITAVAIRIKVRPNLEQIP